MSWIVDIIKHLEISKAFTGAVFVSTLCILIAPKFFPTIFDIVPTEWRWFVIFVCIFSGVLLAIWSISLLFRFVAGYPSRIFNNPRLCAPKAKEKKFLLFLGEYYPDKSVNLDEINNEQISKLETLEIVYNLQRKNLIEINPFYKNFIDLTEEGRKYALRLMSKNKRGQNKRGQTP